MHNIILICLVLSAVSLQSSTARPDGASAGACRSMLPGHPFPPQTGIRPFDLVPAALTVNRGQRLNITLSARDIRIAGFLLQARDADEQRQLIGQFVRSEDPRWKLMNCFGAIGNSATHTAPTPHLGLTLEWQAPSNFTGRVIFYSSVAASVDTYWLGIRTQPITVE